MRPNGIIPTIRSYPKAREMEELRTRIAKLLKENADAQAQLANRNRRLEEAEAAEEGRIRAEAESTKWHGVSQKFFDSVGFTGDVVTKARLFDQCMKKPEAMLAPKILWMLVDFSGRVENLLKELRLVFQHSERGQEAEPSERRPESVPEPARREPTSPPTSTPGAPPTGGPFASIPRPKATPPEPKPAATPAIPDPTQQEPIPDSLNTDDTSSLH